jgi:hypothetical protein
MCIEKEIEKLSLLVHNGKVAYWKINRKVESSGAYWKRNKEIESSATA